MSEPAQLWADPILVYPVAALAATLLLATVWLFRRPKRSGRQAAVICLVLSALLHVLLLALVPLANVSDDSGGGEVAEHDDPGTDAFLLSTFDPEMEMASKSGRDDSTAIDPLPVANLTELLDDPPGPNADDESDRNAASPTTSESDRAAGDDVPASLSANEPADTTVPWDEFDSALNETLEQAFLEDDAQRALAAAPVAEEDPSPPAQAAVSDTDPVDPDSPSQPVDGAKATVAGDRPSDFANRVGAAKEAALQQTGGDPETEAAVAAALQFLVKSQRPDGAWDPVASGAGEERAPLGETRDRAGRRAETALTGLALLSLIGAGHTHRDGDHADHVYRGLVYLIRAQKPDGSLAGNAKLYAANYSHGIAALAMAEAAAITGDPAAVEATRRAVAHTQRMQHPTTGGFRYRQGDAGDLSQLGWQAMVLDAGYRAGVRVDPGSVQGIERFLRTVRAGSQGGLARYRPGEAPSRTMTAEGLATRLLLGESVPPAEIAEAQRYLLEKPPGEGQDNYYYWYYATLALHQLQDDAWDRWNEALKARLLATQRSDGSWSSATVWGGYGGTVYTTAMATLCLESYYRHAIRSRDDRIADLPAG